MARRATPLFELLAEQSETRSEPRRDRGAVQREAPASPPAEPGSAGPAVPTAATAAAPGHEASPAAAAHPSGARADAEAIARAPGTAEDGAKQAAKQGVEPEGRAALHVPISAAYIAGAAAILLILIVWTTGYQLGARDKEQELTEGFGTQTAGGIVEPLDELSTPIAEDPVRAREAAERARRSTGSGESGVPGSSGAAGSAQPGDILIASGAATVDPRQPGLNYLVLEQRLGFNEAAEVVRFLSEQGLETIATPVDRSARRSNNPVRYRLIVLQGFEGGASGRFAASKPQRDRIEREAQRLGELWQRQGGSSSFPQPLWMKYQP